MRLVAKSDWRAFVRQDWFDLIDAAAHADIRRALGHVPKIERCLVRQLNLIPRELRLPRIFGVLNEAGQSSFRAFSRRNDLATVPFG